jgi:hypothetical protein
MLQTLSLKKDVLLLDSCSTINLIADKRLLRNIHKVDTPMRVHCNAGVRVTNLMAWMGSFPEPMPTNESPTMIGHLS